MPVLEVLRVQRLLVPGVLRLLVEFALLQFELPTLLQRVLVILDGFERRAVARDVAVVSTWRLFSMPAAPPLSSLPIAGAASPMILPQSICVSFY
jgi:hypothetical protein